jgi:hypothetical protein
MSTAKYKMTADMVQVAEHLPSMHETLVSVPSTTKKKEKKITYIS